MKISVAEGNFVKALADLSQLREPIDAFFDSVLVNVDEANVRLNRLALLQELRNQFLSVADLAVLAR